MAVTLDDIAKRAGVTQAAVSEIIRHHPNSRRFREETRNRVLQIANDLNYHPHFFASQIRAENRRLVMFCVGTLNDPFAAAISQAFEAALADHGYHFLLCSLANRRGQLNDTIVGPHGILALAVVGEATRHHFPDSHLLAMADQGVRIVAIDRRLDTDRITQIGYDREQSIATPLDHLLAQGVRRIWVFGKPGENRVEGIDPLNRVDAAIAYLKGRPAVDCRLVNLGKRSVFEAEEHFARALAAEGLPEAVFCESDGLAWAAMKAIARAGGQVGQDIAVVGFDDDTFSRFAAPPGLTTVSIPAAELGQRAARELVDLYEGRTQPGLRIELSARLVERGSSRLCHLAN